jgi:hypothetical protein
MARPLGVLPDLGYWRGQTDGCEADFNTVTRDLTIPSARFHVLPLLFGDWEIQGSNATNSSRRTKAPFCYISESYRVVTMFARYDNQNKQP